LTATVTDYAAIWDYGSQPRSQSITCNLCGHFETEEDRRPPGGWTEPDRYGYQVGVVVCAECELIYLNPRMAFEAYASFYESGAYRSLVSAYHGREINAETIQPEQERYAVEVADFLEPHVKHPRSLLDVGGSTGVVAKYMKERFGVESSVLDPAGRETDEALRNGLPIIRGTAESFDPDGYRWGIILVCQTIDHLLDPMGVLKKLHGCLADDGLLFVDILDFDKTREIKIDHPYNFTEKTMALFLSKAGYREIARERAPDGVHVRFLCAR